MDVFTNSVKLFMKQNKKQYKFQNICNFILSNIQEETASIQLAKEGLIRNHLRKNQLEFLREVKNKTESENNRFEIIILKKLL